MIRKRILKVVDLLIILAFAVAMFYIFKGIVVKPQQVDYQYHIFEYYYNNIHPDDFYANNNLFRYLINIAHSSGIDLSYASAFLLMFFVLMRVVLYYSLLNIRPIFRSLCSISLCLFMSLMGIRSHYIYIGRWAGNIWHSPTFIVMISFAPICIYSFFKSFIEKKHEARYCIALSISMFLSCVSKPSFVIVFIPACAIWILLSNRNDFSNLVTEIKKGIILSLPTIIYLIMAFIFEYINDGGDSLIIDVLGVWLLYSNSILGILSCMAQSLGIGVLFVLINHKWNDKKVQYLFLLLIIGMLYFSIFAEKIRYSDANFAWSYSSAGLMFNTFLMIDFISNIKAYIKNKFNFVIIALFLVQTCNGIYYIYLLFNSIIHI